MDIVKRLPLWIEQEELENWLNILDTIWSQLQDEKRDFLATKLANIRYAIEMKLRPEAPDNVRSDAPDEFLGRDSFTLEEVTRDVKSERIVELEQKTHILELSNCEREAKIQRQAEQITRLEQSRKSMREHIKFLQAWLGNYRELTDRGWFGEDEENE